MGLFFYEYQYFKNIILEVGCFEKYNKSGCKKSGKIFFLKYIGQK